jgi:hypothetical protein
MLSLLKYLRSLLADGLIEAAFDGLLSGICQTAEHLFD